MNKLIGRSSEKLTLENALKSTRSELIVIYGRRRIGKTFLVKRVYKDQITFEFSGIHKASLKDQLKSFHLKISSKDRNKEVPSDWLEAFDRLVKYISTRRKKGKKIIFIDEFPWLATRKSRFLAAFDNFWNSYAAFRSDIVVVVCGSAASYMINNIIKSKGGLHNRLTEIIRLLPLNLNEVEKLLTSHKVKLSRYDITKVYMAIGGVPHYLEKISPGDSVAQILDKLCFYKDGFLRAEFDNVFASLFDQYENHEKVVRVLASVKKGLTRKEILSKSKFKSGGRLTTTLNELAESGFIEKYAPYKGTKSSLFRLIDEYSMFYIKYIEKTSSSNTGIWLKMQGSPSYKIWSGFSFETICIKHVEQIKEGLKIGGIGSTHGSWIEKKSTNGAQIDLLIDREDNVINLCEMKFYNTQYTIDKKYAGEIVNKQNAFIQSTKTKKSIFVTFITSYGLASNKHSIGLVQKELNLSDLFVNI